MNARALRRPASDVRMVALAEQLLEPLHHALGAVEIGAGDLRVRGDLAPPRAEGLHERGHVGDPVLVGLTADEPAQRLRVEDLAVHQYLGVGDESRALGGELGGERLEAGLRREDVLGVREVQATRERYEPVERRRPDRAEEGGDRGAVHLDLRGGADDGEHGGGHVDARGEHVGVGDRGALAEERAVRGAARGDGGVGGGNEELFGLGHGGPSFFWDR